MDLLLELQQDDTIRSLRLNNINSSPTSGEVATLTGNPVTMTHDGFAIFIVKFSCTANNTGIAFTATDNLQKDGTTVATKGAYTSNGGESYTHVFSLPVESGDSISAKITGALASSSFSKPSITCYLAY